MQVTSLPTREEPGAEAPRARSVSSRRGLSDRVFNRGLALAGISVLALMSAVGVFLTIEALDAFGSEGLHFFTETAWEPDRRVFGVAAILLYTVLIAVIAVAIAIPLAMGTALFIVEVVPQWLRATFVAVVDLMAAVPSVVYGLWGLFFLQGHVIGLSRFLTTWLGWIPIFRVTGDEPTSPLASGTVYTASTFIAGLVVSMMVMPIACSVMREVFSQVPAGEREGAFALGSTRWGMIRTVTLPFGRGGIIGGTMLGLGRALGETIAVYLIISPRFDINFHVLENGSNSVSALIALRTPEASGFGLSSLMAAGLTLFAVTLVVNFVASIFVARSRSGASSEA